MTFHPLSVLAGGGFLGLVLVVTGAVQRSPKQTARLFTSNVRVVNPVDVVGIPDPRDIIVVEAGVPYVVPTGRILVVTALGNDLLHLDSGRVDLRVDGKLELSFSTMRAHISMLPVPPHLTIAAGSTVDVVSVATNGPSSAEAWGYLIDP